jgi:tetratricopeptide (TPR) repeat protein
MEEVLMKKRLVLFGFICIFITNVYASSFQTVENVKFDWNGDKKPDQFLLEATKDDFDHGCGTKLHIKLSGKKEFTYENIDRWTGIESVWVYKTSIIESSFFAFLPIKSNSTKDVLLFLFGWAYGSSPGDLYIFALNQNGDPELIFNKQFDMSKFEDLNNDGVCELVGVPWYTQGWGNGYTSYIPHLVYSFTKINGHFISTLNSKLSEKYCNDHGYLWAGPDYIKDKIVVTPPNSDKQVLMKQEEADKLFLAAKANETSEPTYEEIQKKRLAMANSLSDEGYALYQEHKDALAIEKYEAALKKDWNGEIFYRYGNSLANLKRFDEAAEAYFHAIQCNFKKVHLVYYNIACCYSQMHKPKATFKFLQLAIEKGYNSFKYMEKDPDLAYIRSQPEWKNWFSKHQK